MEIKKLSKAEKIRKAQNCIRNNPTRWGWVLAMWLMKKAYGIEEDEPMPIVGDINGNYICTYSNADTGEYHFIAKRVLEKRGLVNNAND
ncbi:hypothetical protein [Pectobacterium parmentieri]|uniref:hypothetical protein n=1 Tax=Pectobacterium parmentieri TaxID=1905730 RepID=UPI000EB1314D|nr:hypothetical protein [Pectobacterium parmentieri]AYH32994.1 hypothetical protein C5E19_15965 [Pectobacterium parmentieri]